MAEGEAFVDVTYRGLDVGARLKLTDFGPETGYLEMSRPLPVGAILDIATDEGHALRVAVLRVHEQVAGAEMPPGMRVRLVRSDGGAAEWWAARAERDDPAIPTPPPPPKATPLAVETVGVPADREGEDEEGRRGADEGAEARGDAGAGEGSEPAEPSEDAARAGEDGETGGGSAGEGGAAVAASEAAPPEADAAEVAGEDGEPAGDAAEVAGEGSEPTEGAADGESGGEAYSHGENGERRKPSRQPHD